VGVDVYLQLFLDLVIDRGQLSTSGLALRPEKHLRYPDVFCTAACRS